MYHISPEMTQHVLTIHDSLTFIFIDLHVQIPRTNLGSLTTPLGIPECATRHTQGFDINLKINHSPRVDINDNQLSKPIFHQSKPIV
jgi:hypothetical protein